jgi:2Fe-2S ferredoxin
MPKITYVSPGGSQHIIDADIGATLMETAIQQGVPGIIAECGGAGACATCHVYISDEYAELIGPADGLEDDMLDSANAERTPTSRLACQVTIDNDFEGLVVDIADEQ